MYVAFEIGRRCITFFWQQVTSSKHQHLLSQIVVCQKYFFTVILWHLLPSKQFCLLISALSFLASSPVESGLDLELRYIENVLTDYDSQYLQTSESDWCHLVTIGQFAKFKMCFLTSFFFFFFWWNFDLNLANKRRRTVIILRVWLLRSTAVSMTWRQSNVTSANQLLHLSMTSLTCNVAWMGVVHVCTNLIGPKKVHLRKLLASVNIEKINFRVSNGNNDGWPVLHRPLRNTRGGQYLWNITGGLNFWHGPVAE